MTAWSKPSVRRRTTRTYLLSVLQRCPSRCGSSCPSAARQPGPGRWFEEDCDWNVALAFPQFFSDDARTGLADDAEGVQARPDRAFIELPGTSVSAPEVVQPAEERARLLPNPPHRQNHTSAASPFQQRPECLGVLRRLFLIFLEVLPSVISPDRKSW